MEDETNTLGKQLSTLENEQHNRNIEDGPEGLYKINFEEYGIIVTNGEVSEVSLYLNSISKVRLLSREDEIFYANFIRRGVIAAKRLENNTLSFDERKKYLKYKLAGKIAREVFIQSNLRLVVSIAKKYTGHGVGFLDLVQEGNIGMIKAVDKFNPNYGNKFSTLATWWIRQAITRVLSESADSGRVPSFAGGLTTKSASAGIQHELEYGETMTDEILEELGFSKLNIRTIRLVQQLRYAVSLDYQAEEGDRPFGDSIEDTAQDVEAAAMQMMLTERLTDVLATLSVREAKVIELRFGLKDGRSYTLEEIGKKYGVTRERIRQIEAKALTRLRHPRRSRKLRDFLE